MLLSQGQETEQSGVWKELKDELTTELDESQKELTEISLMLEQSQLELTKLTQRNASITTHLQQVQGQIDSLPRADIRMAYDAALDAQQRLFVMRGQLEKLQSDHTHIGRYAKLMEKVIKALEGGAPAAGRGQTLSDAAETVEMIIQAQESERQRLARLMHDEPAQALSNFILQTEIAMRLFDVDPARAKEELTSLKSAATSTFQKVRDFIFEMRPMMLDDLGLAPTLNRYIEAFKEKSGVDIRLSVSGMEQRLESYVEVMIFRAIQELVSNAVRHSQATQIRVQVDGMDANIKVMVDDNGKGFDPETALEHGMGIKLIHDRVNMLGGTIEIDSQTGQGSRIAFQVPATKTKVFA